MVSDSLATRAVKRPKAGGSGELHVSSRKVAWLKVACYTCIENCEWEWKCLNN